RCSPHERKRHAGRPFPHIATLMRATGKLGVNPLGESCVRRSYESRGTDVPLPGILHSMSVSSLSISLPVDGRQSATPLAVAGGATRLLHSLGYSVVGELSLASGRRADLVALGGGGELWIVE